jgi:hypothetical protein
LHQRGPLAPVDLHRSRRRRTGSPPTCAAPGA